MFRVLELKEFVRFFIFNLIFIALVAIAVKTYEYTFEYTFDGSLIASLGGVTKKEFKEFEAHYHDVKQTKSEDTTSMDTLR